MPRIAYLCDPEKNIEILDKVSKLQIPSSIVCDYDYAGGVCIGRDRFARVLERIPGQISEAILSLSNFKDESVHLRSSKYYLHLLCDNPYRIKKEVVNNYRNLTSLDGLLEDPFFRKDYDTRLVLSSIKDHQKHYVMVLLSTLFYHSLQGGECDVLNAVLRLCEQSIESYYSFLLMGEYLPQRVCEEVLSFFSTECNMPEPSFDHAQNITSSAGRKMIIREMDHPVQILLFAGQMLKDDGYLPVDFILNPLNGALEIGYAIRSIYKLLGIDKVQDIFLARYSLYEDKHCPGKVLSDCVPVCLKDSIGKLGSKRIIIVDDNTFSGNTLANLRELVRPYSDNVHVAAIERRTDWQQERSVNYEDLLVKPISKLRYIGRVERFIRSNNLYDTVKNGG